MFDPPRCPNPACTQHASPRARFFVRNGHYPAKCRAHPVQRFVCKACGRSFSRQTFRQDYRDHKPHLNAELFSLLTSGVGLRQSSRLLGLSLRCTELKFRKIARHARELNRNLRGDLPREVRLQLDELETYEGRRNTRPVTLAVLIERPSRFMVGAESAPIPPSGKMSESRLEAIREDEKRFGKRRNESRRAVRAALREGARMAQHSSCIVLETDEKSTYPSLAREAFGCERLVHERTNSKLARGTWNPLFPINHSEAMARDLVGRLRRDSWLVSKLRRYLDLGMELYMAYRNYVRRRFNWDEQSPAQVLGFVERRMTPTELLSWRQDWGSRSIHPLARRNESVAELLAA